MDQINLVLLVLTLPLLIGDIVLYLVNIAVPGLIEEGDHKVARISAAVVYIYAPPRPEPKDVEDIPLSIWNIDT